MSKTYSPADVIDALRVLRNLSTEDMLRLGYIKINRVLETTEDPQARYTVTLTSVGDQVIQVIKTVKTEGGYGLADAKALVDRARGYQMVQQPTDVAFSVSKAKAQRFVDALQDAGATARFNRNN